MKSDSMSNSENNKRIAKNTLMLYFRLLITMVVSLYTSRIVLNTLGISDFGIYNIVGGVVILFAFLNQAMSNATQRFLNFEIGKKDFEQLKKVFSASITIHVSIAIIVLVLSETIGLWFVNTQLNLPAERMDAVNWVYQFTILTFIINIIRVPYNAIIIAHEQMSFYAYVSIIEVLLKLSVVFLLQYLGYDKLKLYGVLISAVAIIVISVYKIYCNKKFESSRYSFFWDASIYKQLGSYSGWSLFGGIAAVGAQQGLNILLNIFWGVAVNAAMGIAAQVSSAVYSFTSSFQKAFNPQIVKSYASNDRTYFMSLIFQASRFSYYLVLFLALPILINTTFILEVWLQIVPEYSASFCRLIILYLLIDAIWAPLWMSVEATGVIRNYQILLGSLILLNIPLTYIFLKLGFPPECGLFIRVVINLITFFATILYLRPRIDFPARQYIREVILPVSLVTLMALPLPLIVNQYFSNWGGFIVTTITAVLSTLLCIYVVGIKKNEREFLNRLILNKIMQWNQ